MTSGAIINHLWQSSCFVALAGLLALLLRKNPAKVRYWVWLSASLKFLVPFAMLVSLGNLVPRPVQSAISVPVPVVTDTLLQIAEPFSPPSDVSVPSPAQWMPVVIGIIWALGFIAIACARCRSWFRIQAALRASIPIELPIPIPAFIGLTVAEPGIVGFVRPVLTLPAQLLERLNPRQLDAVLAHELTHVRRRDNLFAAVYMMVEAMFWFHPLVWWIGSRLVEERELACDEEVLRMGCEPTDYAAGILTVCRFYTESPLPCVSGVTGADVKKRLRTILSGSVCRELSFAKKLVLMAAGLMALAAPFVIGVLNAPFVWAQSILTGPPGQPRPTFEVASVKATTQRHGVQLDGARYSDSASLLSFIVMAYGLNSCAMRAGSGVECPLIAGAIPTWADVPPMATANLFEIQAKLPDNPRISSSFTPMQVREGRITQLSLMLQVLLEDRFHLKVHREMRELPVYVLTFGKNGPKLKATSTQELTDAADGTKIEHHGQSAFEPVLAPNGARIGKRRVVFQGTSMQQATESLTSYMDRPLLNRTGLKGEYDFKIEYDVDPDASYRSGGVMANLLSGLTCAGMSVSLEDLGLKCESAKGPVEVLVIDHVEKPSEN